MLDTYRDEFNDEMYAVVIFINILNLLWFLCIIFFILLSVLVILFCNAVSLSVVSCSTSRPVISMWNRGWELPSRSAPSFLQTGECPFMLRKLLWSCHSAVLVPKPHIPLAVQVHHCGGARLECAGLPVRLHLLSVWRSQRLWCGDHALQRPRRYDPLENMNVMLRNVSAGLTFSFIEFEVIKSLKYLNWS